MSNEKTAEEMKAMKLQYKAICRKYANLFCKKQGFYCSDFHWVAGDVGGIVSVADYYFNFSDIVFDVNSKQEKGLIIKWYDAELENPNPNHRINYQSYSNGLRRKDVAAQFQQLAPQEKAVSDAKGYAKLKWSIHKDKSCVCIGDKTHEEITVEDYLDGYKAANHRIAELEKDIKYWVEKYHSKCEDSAITGGKFSILEKQIAELEREKEEMAKEFSEWCSLRGFDCLKEKSFEGEGDVIYWTDGEGIASTHLLFKTFQSERGN